MPLKTAPPEEPTLNLTPMIDVILTLILFFMVAAKFTEEERAMEVKVPAVSSKGTISSAPEPRIVNVYPDGRIQLGTQQVSIEELESKIAAAKSQYSKLSVLVRGDINASHGRMTEVYDACRRAGVAEVAVSVRLDTKKR